MRHKTASTCSLARGFTLIELLITIFVIAVLMGLLVVGFSRAIRAARRTAGTQDVHSLTMAVEQFRTQFDFIPPLVKDGYADTPDSSGPLVTVGRRSVPNVYNFGDTATDLPFLRGEGSSDPRYRFSIYSLPYYLMGALGKEVDGREGLGAMKPLRDGSFDPLTNDDYDPLYDAQTGNIEYVDAAEGRIELRDGKGNAYRYYRWAPGTMDPSDDDKGVINLPPLVATGRDIIELGDAGYAIVGAGPDGVFGDIGLEAYPGQPASARESVELIEDALGKRFGQSNQQAREAAAEAAAREDNIVGVGR